MKLILTVASVLPEDGGPSRSVPALAKALLQEDIDVELCTLAAKGDVGGIVPTVLPSLKALKNYLKAQFEEHYGNCIVHDNGVWLPFNYTVCSVARSCGIPYLVTTRGMLEPWCLRHHYLKKKLAWWLYQKRLLQGAACLHATGESEAQQLKELGLTPDVLNIPNGVTIPQKRAPLKESSKNVLYLSRLHPKKGIEMLLEAWADLKPTGWNLKLAGSGEPAYVESLKSHSRQLGVGVQWLGELDDQAKWNAYHEADFFVLPTYSENFGIVVAEALASGTPVITTNQTPWLDLEMKGCGFCVSPEFKAIRHSIATMLETSHETRLAMGGRGRGWMASDYSWSSIASGFLGFYSKMINNH